MAEPQAASLCTCGARTQPHPKGETPCVYLSPGQPVYSIASDRPGFSGRPSPALRAGDVIRYEPGKRIGDNVYWCREGLAIVHERDGNLVAYDTYWSTTDGQDRLTDSELASAEVVFNLDDYEPVRDEWRWKKYAPADRQVVTAQHRLQKRYYVRKGATEDLATQIDNARQRMQAARSKVEVAVSSLEWEVRQLAELEAAACAAAQDTAKADG